MTPRLVLATRNHGKLAELHDILADATGRSRSALSGVVVAVADLPALGLPDPGDVAETEVSFTGNALLKARAVAAATGLPAVADDSGLTVGVLGAAPGVFSARWAGRHGDDEANVALLLAQLADVGDADRRAWFTCAAALVAPPVPSGADQRETIETVTEGRLAGTLTRSPRGGNGFGYDPVLVPDGDTRTCAQLSPAEKNAISHRSQAFRALAPALVALLG